MILIVGQGLAGTLLAHRLLERGCSVRVIDPGHEGCASMVAAGNINPITGRRYARTWLAELLLPYSRAFYTRLERQLGQALYYPKRIGMVLASPAAQNDWLLRSSAAQDDYALPDPDPAPYARHFRDVLSVAELQGGARVDLPALLGAYRGRLKGLGALQEARFDYSALETGEDCNPRYQGETYQGVVFCEGAAAAKRNPFFGYLPFQPSKGEVLLVRIADYGLSDRLVKHRQLFLAPWQGDLYWLGSSYERDFEDGAPTAAGGAYLLDTLRSMLRLPFERVAHWAGIRPTVRDRRPFLGQHPRLQGLYLFNGFGAKGSLTVPYFAEHFADFLLQGKALMPEADIRRYTRFGN